MSEAAVYIASKARHAWKWQAPRHRLVQRAPSVEEAIRQIMGQAAA